MCSKMNFNKLINLSLIFFHSFLSGVDFLLFGFLSVSLYNTARKSISQLLRQSASYVLMSKQDFLNILPHSASKFLSQLSLLV